MGILTSYSSSVDYSALYFSNARVKDLENYMLFISINSYLRTEVPLLNSRVRKSYNNYVSNFKFFAVGVGVSYFTYPIRLIANNKLASLKIFFGKNIFSRFFTSFKNKLVVFCNNSMFFIPFFMRFFEPIIVNLQVSVSSITASHLGLRFNLGMPNTALYSVGADTNSLISPLVYQGSHGVPNISDSLVLLPTSIFAEKTSHYLNVEGLLQKAHVAVTSDRLVKKD